MSGFFGNILKSNRVSNVLYGIDYHSYLGTKRAGLAFYYRKKDFKEPSTALKMAISEVNLKTTQKNSMEKVALV